MRYVIEVTQKQAEEISDLIKKGRYQNFGQFISTAIENQIYIERSDISKQPAFKDALIHIKVIEHDEMGRLQKDIDVSGLTNIQNAPKTLPIPKFENLACFFKQNGLLKEEDIWLWGQVNRIFPIKLGLRVLYVMLGDMETIELETFRNTAGDIALAYGKMIRSYERDNNKSRDKRVSAGLPMDNESFRSEIIIKMHKTRRIEELDSYLKQEEFKSKIRYKGQFLTYARKDDKLDGAMAYLRFANLKEENGNSYIGLTEPGFYLAKLDNPIIDHKDFEKSLSQKEVDFYLTHVLKDVKGESNAIKWLLQKLDSGITDREELNKELKREFGQIWNASDAVIGTQRAGLMARMFELGLIEKSKNGVNVIYKISKSGKNFITKY